MKAKGTTTRVYTIEVKATSKILKAVRDGITSNPICALMTVVMA